MVFMELLEKSRTPGPGRRCLATVAPMDEVIDFGGVLAAEGFSFSFADTFPGAL
jgi:hypothetical protein